MVVCIIAEIMLIGSYFINKVQGNILMLWIDVTLILCLAFIIKKELEHKRGGK